MINRQRLEFLKGKYESEFERAKANQNQVYGRRMEVDKLFTEAQHPEEKKLYAMRSRDLLEVEVKGNSFVNEKLGRINMIEDLIKTVDNMHLGKDPGDGFFGPEGDLDPEREQAVQDRSEAEARKAREETTPSEPSEG